MTSPPMSPPQRHTDRDWLISLVSDRVGAWVKRRVRVGLAIQTLYTCTCLFTELASRKVRVVAHPGISSQDTCTTHRIAVLLGKAGPIQAWRLPSNNLYASLQHSHARQPHSRQRARVRVSRFGLAVRRYAGKQRDLGSNPLRLSFLFKKVVICGQCLVTLFLTINETLKRLPSLPILMQESFWW